MKKKRWLKFLFALLAYGNFLEAEIEEIIMTWNAFKCQSSCIPLIERSFRSIPEVTHLQINGSLGSASMQWKSNEPFSYEPFRYAAAAVGFNITSMRIRVSGTIRSNGQTIQLISQGDQTPFLLIGPVYTEPGRYTPIYNLATHPLTPVTREKLLLAEKNRWTVVISGPLFFPSYYSRTLIVEHIKEPEIDL